MKQKLYFIMIRNGSKWELFTTQDGYLMIAEKHVIQQMAKEWQTLFPASEKEFHLAEFTTDVIEQQIVKNKIFTN